MWMINNTEQRKTSEQAPRGTSLTAREAFDIWYNKNVKYIEPVDVHAWCMAAWQAALAQREQEAPSLCTAEEAAELALHIEMTVSDMDITTFKNGNVHATSAGLATIINKALEKRK
jgi:hypothetical protein